MTKKRDIVGRNLNPEEVAQLFDEQQELMRRLINSSLNNSKENLPMIEKDNRIA